jgi:hypothetical protein
MPRWEYRKIDLGEYGELPANTDEVVLLDAAGDDGWELVAITSNHIAYLKRQIEDPADVPAKPLRVRSSRE